MAARLQHTVLFLLLFGLADETYADCWEEASGRYNVPVTLLKAIAEVESSNRARVVAVNTNGTQDYGFMQINDFWLPKLKRYGIGVDELMDPCTSLNVGAWILAQNIRQMGYGWEAVGAYGAGTRKDKAAARVKYARKVWKVLDRQIAGEVNRKGSKTTDSLQPAGQISIRRAPGILTERLE